MIPFSKNEANDQCLAFLKSTDWPRIALKCVFTVLVSDGRQHT